MAIEEDKIHRDLLLDLFHCTKRIRMVELAVAERYHEQEMRCPVHLSVGQEAVPAAVCALLTNQDLAVSTHRSHGHYLAKGGSLKRMIAEFYGKVEGCSKGKGGSMHLIDKEAGFMGSTAIVGGTIPVGVGLGLSLKLKKSHDISVVFLGEGATEEGVFYESMNFAALKKLPVLFVCENNLYSVYSPLNVRQPKSRRLCALAESMGVKSLSGDGNDLTAAYDTARTAIEHIRSSGEPYFLEFATYRWLEHCGPNYDNDLGYRTMKEFESWKLRDPLVAFERYLVGRGVLTDQTVACVEKKIRQEIFEAFEFALNAPFPKEDEIYADLYKERLP